MTFLSVLATQHDNEKVPEKRKQMSDLCQLIAACRLLHKQKDYLPEQTTTI